MNALKYRPDIDGLRAIAVVPVLLYHARVPLFTGGFIGVDVFFVISGFLITQLIAQDLRQARFSVVAFYERRIRRIFPAFFAMIVLTALLGSLLLPPSELKDLGRSMLGASVFASNVVFWMQSGYFADPAHLKPLLHTWSLALEEQFYFLFPLLLVFLQRALPGRSRRVVIILCLVSFASCIWMTPRPTATAFYLLPFRGWELLVGAVLGLSAVPELGLRRRAVRELAAFAGLACICGAAVCFNEKTSFPGVNALLPCAGAALIIRAGSAGYTWTSRLLSSTPCVFIGKISYSLYLCHWPLLVFAGVWWVQPLGLPQTLTVLAASLLASVASYKFVEQPFRQHGVAPPSSQNKVFIGALSATAAMIVFAVACERTRGFPSRVSAQVVQFDAARTDSNPDRPRCHGSDDAPIEYERKCIYGARAVAPSMAIWGDSLAAELAVALGELAADHHQSIRYISHSGCAPTLGLFHDRPVCESHNAAVLAALIADRRVTRIVLVASYLSYYREFGHAFLRSLEAVIQPLHDAGKEIVLTYPIPMPNGHVPTQLARAALVGRDPATLATSRAKYERDNAEIIGFLDRLALAGTIRAVHPEQTLCTRDRCDVFRDGKVLYFDDTHISLVGARLLRPFFEAALMLSLAADSRVQNAQAARQRPNNRPSSTSHLEDR